MSPPSMRAAAAVAAPALLDPTGLLSTPPPEVDGAALRDALHRHHGLTARLSSLPGERDRNALVEGADGVRSVLKLFNPAEHPASRALQRAVLLHLEGRDLPFAVPRLLRTRDGAEGFTLEGDGGLLDAMLVSFVPGVPRRERPPAPVLRRAVGAATAALGLALADFDHPGARRPLLWDLMRLPDFAPIAAGMADRRRGDWLAAFLDRFAVEIRPRAAQGRLGVIHNDLNGDNVLLGAGEDAVRGVIDFGDAVHAPLACDLAVAGNYGLADADDPVETVADFVEGYGRAARLEVDEAETLFDLFAARLALRVLMYEWRAELFPANRAYTLRSASEARLTLDRVMALPDRRGRDRVMARWRETAGAR